MSENAKKLTEDDFLVKYDQYIHGKLTYQELHDLPPDSTARKQQAVVRSPSQRSAKRR